MKPVDHIRLVAATAIAALTLSTWAQAQTKWTLPAGGSPSSFQVTNLVEFANDVEKASGGKLRIDVFPAATLFKASDIKPAVQMGATQIGEVTLADLQAEWDVFGADSLPFLVNGYDDAKRLWKAQRPLLERKLAAQGVMVLYAVPSPPIGVFSTKAISSASDLKGLKLRAPNPSYVRLAELLGAKPVAMSFAEVRQALANKQIDLQFSNAPTGLDLGFDTGTRYWYDSKLSLPKNAVLVNKAAFDALDAQAKAAVLRAGADAESRGWAASQRVHDQSRTRLSGKGMTILPSSPALESDTRAFGQTLLDEWKARSGPEGKQLIDLYVQSAHACAQGTCGCTNGSCASSCCNKR